MLKKLTGSLALIVLLLAAGCEQQPEPLEPADQIEPGKPTEEANSEGAAETSEPAGPAAQTAGVLISELLPGVPGGNSTEFIELYNTSTEPVDLNGWSLWYLLGAGQEETLVYQWDSPADVPGLGHYLLVHQGQEVGLTADAWFDIALFERKGGVALRDASGADVDRLGWGDAADGFFAGTPSPAPDAGASLERLPGGELGGSQNSGDNSADLAANEAPNPQNSGSSLTPLPEKYLTVSLTAPDSVEPGMEFELSISVENHAGQPVNQALVSLPVADYFTVISAPEGAVRDGERLSFSVDEIGAGETAAAVVRLKSPFTYVDTIISGTFAQADGLLRAYGSPHLLAMAGGSVPIAAARQLVGNVVTIEGVATMYTGGLFAGSSGTKFYLDDGSGGVQVYVPGGLGVVRVDIGDRVRVTGEVEVYRDSLEVIPASPETDIEIVGSEQAPEPMVVSVLDNETESFVLGRLVVAEGTASRIEEQTYSYEVDLTDDDGYSTLVYIDKLTGVTTEPMDLGKRYRITGISEAYSGKRQIYPRLQSDIGEIFPPVLSLSISAPINAAAGDEMVYTITALNHTEQALTGLEIKAVPPAAGVVLNEVLDGGVGDESGIVWSVGDLAAGGGSAEVRFAVTVADDAGERISMAAATAAAVEWPEPASTSSYLTFVGSGVPVWAIQGEAESSPYVRQQATTEGVVSGVFPELGGFWIQSIEPDDNPATSEAVFVLFEADEMPVALGDLIRLDGRVRELSGQTLLHLQGIDDLTLLASDQPLPASVSYDPPEDAAEALAYNESLEGMLVKIDQPAQVVAPTTRYGEYVMVAQKWGVSSVGRLDEVGYLMFADDGSSMTHEDQSTLPYGVQVGDTVTFLEGPLAFTYGNYKIEPLAAPDLVRSESPLPSFAAAGRSQFSVATFNVENLFDIKDPHPSSPPRPSLDAYRARLHKLAEAVLAMGAPTVVGLQEVENIGVLEDLVEQEQLASYGYLPYLIEGTDSRGIDVGYIVRSDQATVSGFTTYVAPEGLTSRPPLVITTTVHLASGDQVVYLLNNHFTSMSAGVEATEPRRTAQAAWNVSVMEQILAGQPDAMVIVMGDLNSFYQSLPIDTLRAAGLHHVYELVEQDGSVPYTYIYQGRTQTLDHILVSDGLFAHLTAVEALHISADYPITNLEDGTAQRVGDHDPLIALFTFE